MQQNTRLKELFLRFSNRLRVCHVLGVFAAVALAMTIAPTALASDIYVVDTIDRAATRQFGQALADACGSCGELKYRQMNGNLRSAKRIAEELAVEEKAGRLSLVVTLGRPATRVVADRLEATPVLYTFVGQPIEQYQNSDRIFGLPTDAPLAAQVNLLRQLLPGFKSAGIVVGEGADFSGPGERAEQIPDLNIYRINDRKELASALRTAVQMNDALILVRDQMVVNNDSIKFVLRHTLENGRHTVAYSRSLVDMGLAAALVPRPEAFGRLLGASVEVFLTGGQLEIRPARDTDYHVHTNPRVLEQLNRMGRPLAAASFEAPK